MPMKVDPRLLRWRIELHLEELCLGLPRMLQKPDCKAGQTESTPGFPEVEPLSHGGLLTPRRQASLSSWEDNVGVSWPYGTAAFRPLHPAMDTYGVLLPLSKPWCQKLPWVCTRLSSLASFPPDVHRAGGPSCPSSTRGAPWLLLRTVPCAPSA